MLNRVGTGILAVLILFFFSKPGPLFAEDKTDSSRNGPVILVISKSNENEKEGTAGKHQDQDILVAADLKGAIEFELTVQHLNFFFFLQ